MAKKTFSFKTEMTQLLHLITHSLYSHREIFLRELISNACDAIDKARIKKLQASGKADEMPEWKIRIIPDKEVGTLTVSDNGIGMSREEIVKNLGTIAHSGTRAFLEKVKEEAPQNAAELIGQFGVGFYSAFMVADKVTVISRAEGEPAVQWESEGTGKFTVSDAEREACGTDVILHLKEDAKEFLEPWKIREVVKKFSDFIEHPIVLVTRDGKEEKEEQLNSRKALWLRSPNEIKPEEYAEFYKLLTHDFEEPAKVIHYHAEGTIEFRALLFIPKRRPFDLLVPHEARSRIHLYIQRVFISDEFDNLLPAYLRFVKGVVDSSDLPLNVSREILQENPLLEKIRRNLTGRIFKTLEEMKKKEPEKYREFFREFGPILKEGLETDPANREKIVELLLFESTATKPGEFTDLAGYVERMPEDQKEIYYITGESRAAIEHSPYLEALREKGTEVLLMTDPIDEFVVPYIGRYKEKPLKAVHKGETEEEKHPQAETFEKLLAFAREKLKGVRDVRLSSRLKESPALLVGDAFSLSPHVEEMMRRAGHTVPRQERVLELNPDHPLVRKALELYEKNPQDERLEDLLLVLRDEAVLTSGGRPEDPAAFTRRLNALLAESLAGGEKKKEETDKAEPESE